MTMQIRVSLASADKQLHRQVEQVLMRTCDDCSLASDNIRTRSGSLDPSVLVALVGVAGTALGALITGLLRLSAERQQASLEIQGENWGVKVPANISEARLAEVVELAKANRVDRIVLGE